MSYNHVTNSFVVLQAEHTSDNAFWIGKTISVVRDRQNVVASINVHWYEVGSNGDCFDGISYL